VIDQDNKVEGDLRRDLAMNIKRHMDLGTYRGLRHAGALPVARTADSQQCPHAARVAPHHSREENGSIEGLKRGSGDLMAKAVAGGRSAGETKEETRRS